MQQKFSIYTKAEYIAEVTKRLDQSEKGERAVLATLLFHPEEPEVSALINAATNAAKRGASVTLLVDAFSFLISSGIKPGPLFFHKTIPHRLRPPFLQRHASIQSIITAGGRAAILNPPSSKYSNPFEGRSHIKFAVIEHSLFVGGCNFDAVDHIDYMLEIKDKNIAQKIITLSKKLASEPVVTKSIGRKDMRFSINDDSELLIDVGLKDQSIIYDEAIQLIDSARDNITITSQYFPIGRTAFHLLQAHRRGVAIKILYNFPSRPEHGFATNVVHRLLELKNKRTLPKIFFIHKLPKKQSFMHAKILLTDKGCIIGSHNYLNGGVRLGTAEMALLSTDKKIAKMLHDKLQATIN